MVGQSMALDGQRHSLLLVQFNSSIASRTFLDYETPAAAMDGVCLLYEKELQFLNPKVPNMTYDISDLYNYIDQLEDLSLLIYQESMHGYVPRNKDWMKKQLHSHLRGQAGS